MIIYRRPELVWGSAPPPAIFWLRHYSSRVPSSLKSVYFISKKKIDYPLANFFNCCSSPLKTFPSPGLGVALSEYCQIVWVFQPAGSGPGDELYLQNKTYDFPRKKPKTPTVQSKEDLFRQKPLNYRCIRPTNWSCCRSLDSVLFSRDKYH